VEKVIREYLSDDTGIGAENVQRFQVNTVPLLTSEHAETVINHLRNIH
jgi:hypothetical protein